MLGTVTMLLGGFNQTIVLDITRIFTYLVVIYIIVIIVVAIEADMSDDNKYNISLANASPLRLTAISR